MDIYRPCLISSTRIKAVLFLLSTILTPLAIADKPKTVSTFHSDTIKCFCNKNLTGNYYKAKNLKKIKGKLIIATEESRATKILIPNSNNKDQQERCNKSQDTENRSICWVKNAYIEIHNSKKSITQDAKYETTNRNCVSQGSAIGAEECE